MHNFIITIDQGNTTTTLSLFDSESCLLSSFSLADLGQITSSYQLNDTNTHAIISSVKKNIAEVPFKTLNIASLLKKYSFLDMPVSYSETLGLDRLALAYPLFKKEEDTLCLDSGSFTTIDYIDKKGFCGGYILPGLKLLLEAYKTGDNLQEASLDLENHLPKNTLEAISRGATLSFLSPIKEILFRYPQAKVFATGGNGKVLKEIDREIHYHPHLIHDSLFFIAKEVL